MNRLYRPVYVESSNPVSPITRIPKLLSKLLFIRADLLSKLDYRKSVQIRIQSSARAHSV